MSTIPFDKLLISEEACKRALFKAKWPEGFRCPRCSGRRAYRIETRDLFECADCGYQASLTAGTVFENTRTPLVKWFTALYMVSRPEGISAKSLQSLIGVTYKTAWTMLTKIRYAMHRKTEAQLLTGLVLIHRDVYGRRPFQPMPLPQPYEHPIIVAGSIGGWSEADPGLERIKMKWLPKSRDPYAHRSWMPSSPDPFRHLFSSSHDPLNVKRYDIECFKERYVCPHAIEVPPKRKYQRWRHHSLHLILREATDWIRKTFYGVTTKHLQAYLDEFSYRYEISKRMTREASAVAEDMLRLCVSFPALTYKDLTRQQYEGWRPEPSWAA